MKLLRSPLVVSFTVGAACLAVASLASAQASQGLADAFKTALEGQSLLSALLLSFGAGVATSTSEVGRLLKQGAVRAGNRVLAADGLLAASDLLAGQYLLLRKGKRDFVVGKVSRAG